jgi:predicted PurR-regulated permease PerM
MMAAMSPRPLAVPGSARYLFVAASVVVVVAGLKAAQGIFVPTLLAFFLAILSFPLLFWLRTHRVPRLLAILITMLAVLAVLVGIGLFISASVRGVTAAAPRYQARLQGLVEPGIERLEARGLDVSSWVTSDLLDLGQLLNFLGNTFVGVAQAVGVGLVVVLIMMFVMAEALGFRRKLARALGRDSEVLPRFLRITREVQRYLLIKTGVSLATGVSIGVGVALIGLDFPLFWGFVAFLLNYVPNIGSVVAGVPAVLLALVQLGLGPALVTAALYVVVNVLLGNIVEPNLMGRRLRLSPLVVLLSLLFWGWLWGPVGMLLAVPLTMILKIMMENTDSLVWLAVLLDQNPPLGNRREGADKKDGPPAGGASPPAGNG